MVRIPEKSVGFPVVPNEKVMLAWNPMLGVRALTEVLIRNSKGHFYLRNQGRKGSISDRRLWGFCFVAVWVEPEGKFFSPQSHYSALCISHQPTDIQSRERKNFWDLAGACLPILLYVWIWYKPNQNAKLKYFLLYIFSIISFLWGFKMPEAIASVSSG